MSRYHNRSFTLAEIIVTVGIVTLMTSLLVPNFGPFRQKQTLERAASELRNRMLEAQSYALAPRRIDNNIVGYSFGFATAASNPVNQNTFATAKLANPRSTLGGLTINLEPNIIDSFTLPPGVTFGLPTAWSANTKGVYQIDFLIGSGAKAEASTDSGYKQSGIIDIPLIRGTDQKVVKISLDTGSVTIEQR